MNIKESPDNKSKGTFCGSNSPGTVSGRGNLIFKFKTDASVNMAGFKVSWVRHECGGVVTEEGIIQSPVHPDNYFHDSNCTWTIQAPANMAIEIKFNKLELEAHQNCRYDYVGVYDGPLINETQLIGMYCGNQTVSPPVINTVSNVAILQFKTDATVNAGGFQAAVKFTYGPQQGCGGNIDLTNIGQKQISSVDIDSDGKYEPDLNCHWLITSDQSKVIKLRFTSFDLEVRENGSRAECWDYVEVRDGPGPYSPLMGRFCGNTAPADIMSSSSTMWIKFFSDGANNNPGFSASISQETPICGNNLLLNSSSIPAILTSPSFGIAYPNNIRCSWIISAPDRENVRIKILLMDVESSTGCTKDMLTIQDER